MSDTKTYLITGANRGLGRGLLEALVQRQNTTVIAGVRDLSSTSSKSLSDISTATGSRIIPLAISSTDDLSPSQAVEALQKTHSVTSIDVVIANAGISQYYGKVSETPLSEVRDHFEVNTIGVLTLYQATLPLLLKSPTPVFVALSTSLASIGAMGDIPVPATPYGMSKVALNYMVRKIHFENEKLTAFVLTPGWVQTDMGNAGATAIGLESAPVKIEESIKGMLEKIDNATREGTSGTLQSFDETKYPW
ncbi:hypothetical protein BELL_0970g00010 [Botrytis elliptica]|uniref:Uncharacterized protein n=1 Tax=Botrytis elliptica TaxID=278938 RepID=A0A4Z1IY34_9HELO|nr:hypothetical protein EAE99_009832 [Botrytis elliptica]TGO66256.1 hypothetical protein BELL_0970g00010 [Botrytis elliptica]